MSWCSAVGCSNCRRNCKNTGVSFHRIPKDENLKRQWETKLKRQILPKNINVCSEHFTEECFDVSSKLQLEMLGTKKRRMPTLFVHREEKRRTLLWRTWTPKNNKPGEKIINFLFSLSLWENYTKNLHRDCYSKQKNCLFLCQSWCKTTQIH